MFFTGIWWSDESWCFVGAQSSAAIGRWPHGMIAAFVGFLLHWILYTCSRWLLLSAALGWAVVVVGVRWVFKHGWACRKNYFALSSSLLLLLAVQLPIQKRKSTLVWFQYWIVWCWVLYMNSTPISTRNLFFCNEILHRQVRLQKDIG